MKISPLPCSLRPVRTQTHRSRSYPCWWFRYPTASSYCKSRLGGVLAGLTGSYHGPSPWLSSVTRYVLYYGCEQVDQLTPRLSCKAIIVQHPNDHTDDLACTKSKLSSRYVPPLLSDPTLMPRPESKTLSWQSTTDPKSWFPSSKRLKRN